MERLGVFLLPLDGKLVYRRSLPRNLLGFPNNSPVPVCTPGSVSCPRTQHRVPGQGSATAPPTSASRKQPKNCSSYVLFSVWVSDRLLKREMLLLYWLCLCEKVKTSHFISNKFVLGHNYLPLHPQPYFHPPSPLPLSVPSTPKIKTEFYDPAKY